MHIYVYVNKIHYSVHLTKLCCFISNTKKKCLVTKANTCQPLEIFYDSPPAANETYDMKFLFTSNASFAYHHMKIMNFTYPAFHLYYTTVDAKSLQKPVKPSVNSSNVTLVHNQPNFNVCSKTNPPRDNKNVKMNV